MALWDAIRGILRGILQYALYLIPLIQPMQEASYPPGWWSRYWGYWDWVANLDSDRRPNQSFIEKYLHAHFGFLVDGAVAVANAYADVLRVTLQNLMGWLPWRFSSFSQWLANVENTIGLFMPHWANNVIHALTRLYFWLPPEIRDGVRSWGEQFDSIFYRAIDWVRAWGDSAIARVGGLWDWLSSKGYQLGDWWEGARELLDRFRHDPGGFVRGILGEAWNWLVDFRNDARARVFSWLGDTWVALVTFRNGPLEYYFDLWGAHGQRLGNFLADPMGYLYDHAEQFLADKLG